MCDVASVSMPHELPYGVNDGHVACPDTRGDVDPSRGEESEGVGILIGISDGRR